MIKKRGAGNEEIEKSSLAAGCTNKTFLFNLYAKQGY
jgi:hypothetical protein